MSTSMALPVVETFSASQVPPGTYTLSLRASNQSGVSSSSNSVAASNACGSGTAATTQVTVPSVNDVNRLPSSFALATLPSGATAPRFFDPVLSKPE
jgi:hypothetical protein